MDNKNQSGEDMDISLQTLPKQDSLRKRYMYKLLTNFLGMGMSIITQTIIPRGLGPKAYGDFNFLTNFFSQVVGFLDMGTSTAFYIKVSQRQKELALVSFYLYFMGIVFLGTISLVYLCAATSIHTMLWPSQELFYIYLAAIWGGLSWATMVLNSIADAYGVTVSAELARMFQKILGLAFIFFLYVMSILNLTTFFYYQYFLFLSLCLAFVFIMRQGPFMQWNWRLDCRQIKEYSKEFYRYSHPLFTYSLLAVIIGLLDRWLLQVCAGSIQQGFYGLSYQIGTLCFLFVGAMTPLFKRELSIAFGNRDMQKMTMLFRRYVPLLYSVAAFFSCFVAVQADKVVYIFGGNTFEGSVTTVMIMAFYPLHQTYGQLSGSVFLATGQTSLYRNIGLVMMLIGLPVVYVMVAPKGQGGIGLGANGLAIKMVFLNLTWVNVQLYFNSKFLKLSFLKYLSHQILSVVCLLTLAAIATFETNYFFSYHRDSVILNFVIAGILYATMVAALIYWVPIVFGLKKRDIQFLIEKIRR